SEGPRYARYRWSWGSPALSFGARKVATILTILCCASPADLFLFDPTSLSRRLSAGRFLPQPPLRVAPKPAAPADAGRGGRSQAVRRDRWSGVRKVRLAAQHRRPPSTPSPFLPPSSRDPSRAQVA